MGFLLGNVEKQVWLWGDVRRLGTPQVSDFSGEIDVHFAWYV